MVKVEKNKLIIELDTDGQAEAYRKRLANSLIEMVKMQDPEVGQTEHQYIVLELVQALV